MFIGNVISGTYNFKINTIQHFFVYLQTHIKKFFLKWLGLKETQKVL